MNVPVEILQVTRHAKHVRAFAERWSGRAIVQGVIAQLWWRQNSALCEFRQPIGVASWQTRLVKSLPKEFKGILPSVEEIEKEFAE